MTVTQQNVHLDNVGDVEVTIEDNGLGQPFLLLHGGAGPQSMSTFASLLARSARSIVPTHPGFVGTTRPAGLQSIAGLASLYVHLLDDLGLDDVTVVGNSVGGWIAAEMALLDSPRIDGVVLLDAVGIEVEGHPVAEISGLPLSEIQGLSFHDPAPFRVDPATMPETQKTIMAANAATLSVYVGSPAMADPTLLSRLKEIDIPTLVLWGESDKIVEPSYGQIYASAIHGARFEMLPATGHMPQMETPQPVLDAIQNSDDSAH